ncbi:hypothetical protein G9A89_016425 [Geosiphon pyriformis]|nr:hypothetical protein G9A89_016425 [Geosiphon pyriformis]
MTTPAKVSITSQPWTPSTSPNFLHSSPIKDRKSMFVAHATRVQNQKEVKTFQATIKAEERTATHHVLAYRIITQEGIIFEDSDDDGETHAGVRLLELLQKLEVKNVAVIVTRWYGGILLGPVRFNHILKSAREVLDKGNLVSEVSNSASPVAGKKPGGYSSIIVNGERQRGNPILQFIRNVQWEYDEIVPDFIIGQTTCALYLSLKYHRLHPEYIFNRIQLLVHQFSLRVLLVAVDVDNHEDPIRELTKISVTNNFTMILAWSHEEAARYIETYKAYEHRPPSLIMEKVESDYHAKLTHCLTQIRSLNKTDVLTLASNFGSLQNIISAPTEDLSMCPGFGDQKIRRLQETFTQNFSYSKAKKKQREDE